MRIGDLRHRIVIQNKIVSRDSMGAEVITWEGWMSAWASIQPLSGREYFQAQQMQSVVDHKITMRYQPGIQSEMRINWNNRNFDILSIINTEERNKELVLMVKEFTT